LERSGLPVASHSTNAGNDSDSESEAGEESRDEVRDEDSDAENSDDEPDLFDWDRFEAPGLSAWDKLGESYDAEAVIGACTLIWRIYLQYSGGKKGLKLVQFLASLPGTRSKPLLSTQRVE
jgi:hypothetical protein